jgi:hypothetical protein
MRTALAILLITTVGLAMTLSWELGAFATADGPGIPIPRPAVAAARPKAAPDHTGEWLTVILARPLFSPDRRPASAIARSPAGGSPEGLPRLSGVLVGPFGRSAIFAADGRKSLVVDEGGKIDAWTIRTIGEDAVEVSGPGGAQTLHPSFASPSGRVQGATMPPQRAGSSSTP